MKKAVCEEFLQNFPFTSDLKHLRSTYIANCVVNSVLTFTSIMLNIVTIYAILKTSSLAKTLKTLLLNLAVSDVGVGLFGQPFYTSLLVNWLQKINPSCYSYMMFSIIGYLFSQASFLGVVAVSVDRLLAVHLHLRYQELVTHKRVVAMVISLWLFSLFTSLTFWVEPDVISVITSICGVITLVFTTLVYVRIYLVARRHRNQIRSLQVHQVAKTGEVANFAGVIKSAVGIFYVYLVFLVCYLPFYLSLASITVNGLSVGSSRFFLYSLTIVYLNSSLNPVIYCWKMRHIRHAILDILRNMSWNRSQLSH